MFISCPTLTPMKSLVLNHWGGGMAQNPLFILFIGGEGIAYIPVSF